MGIHLRRRFLQAHEFGVPDDRVGVEVARIRAHVADLGRSDDLPLGVLSGDLVTLCHVAGALPLSRDWIPLAECIEDQPRH